MDHVLACFGLCGKTQREDLASPEIPPFAEIEESRDSFDEKKSTFTVLVTGMGVSRVIHLSIISSLMLYA
jgi:hypothetical protein